MKNQNNINTDIGMKTVIYCRFSSSSQNEQSIERQLKVCYEYASANGLTVVGEYIDRATTDTNDNRAEFKKLLDDSAKHMFSAVLVYALDRFGRNLHQSTHNEYKLQRNGVALLSATERFSDDPAGRLQRNMMMSFAQYYSDELREKVTGGKGISARKMQFTGGTIPLGYRIEDKRYVLNEETAPIVQAIFTMYASGKKVKEICDYMNERGIKTGRGAEYNKNSLRYLMQNKLYIGQFVYKGELLSTDVIPRIVSDELFYTVGEILERNKQAPAKTRARDEYILTPKLFCGECRKRGLKDILMTGYNGTSKSGKPHFYYACNNGRGSGKTCKKKIVRRSYIEDLVIEQCLAVLTDENIERIAAEIMAISEKTATNHELKRLQKLLKENVAATENLLKAVESGQATELLLQWLNQKSEEKANLQKQIDGEKAGRVELTQRDIMFFLNSLRHGDINDVEYRRMLVTVLVNQIYLEDDKLICIFNAESRPVTVTLDLLQEIDSAAGAGCGCSLNEGCTALQCSAVHQPFMKPTPIMAWVFILKKHQ